MRLYPFFCVGFRAAVPAWKRLSRSLFLFLLAITCLNWSSALAEVTGADDKAPENLDIYLLIGQSNMAGRAPIPGDMAAVSDRCFLLNSEGTWEPASHPLNQYSSTRKRIGMQKLGPAYSFAKKMLEADPDRRIGLIVNARGGTQIDEWLGASKLYAGIRDRAKAVQADGDIKGVLWHQGESDSRNPKGYLEKLKTLIGNLRTDLGDETLPFVAGQIRYAPHQAINDAIAALPSHVPMTAVVSSKGLTTYDRWHFDTPSQIQLGERYAEQMLALRQELEPGGREPFPKAAPEGTVHKDLSNGPFVSMDSEGKLAYSPYTDKGDQIIDFSYAGYKASEEPIPFVRVVETLEPLPGEATQVGTMAYPQGPDSRDRIQAALDRTAALEPDENGFRGAVFLAKGTYYINGGLHLKSGVVLRGEGRRNFGSILIFQNPRSAGITLGSSEAQIEDLEPAVRITDDYVPAGSRQVTVADAGPFSVGDTVHVRKTVNQAWIDILGMDDPGSRSDGREVRPWTPEAYQFDHLRRITGIQRNTLTLDAPLPQSFAEAHGGGEVNRVAMSGYESMMGVEGLRITSNYDTSITSELRATDGPYPADEEHNLHTGIQILKSENVWVRGCRILHTSRSAVRMQDSLYVTVRDTNSLEPVSEIRGRRRYSFSNTDSSMTLVYNCFAEAGRHDFVTGSRDTGPIAFVRGRTANAQGPTETHQRWASGVLFDSITMEDGGGIQVINRGASGSGHGWSGANGVIWNSTAPYIKVENPPTPEQNFAIGSTATAREDAERAGVTGDGFIDSIGKPVQPESLFEQQLIERIGGKQATLVLAETLSKASLPMQVMFPRPVVDGVVQGTATPAQEAFEAADQRAWQTVFSDDGTGDWTEQWFLDGAANSSVSNSTAGMELKALEDHMVLWTKESFKGDLKIEYTFTRTDVDGGGVCIIYIQATGRGDEGYETDITEWNAYRSDASMGRYFRNMHLYHVSYACGYVRGRRYNPMIQRMNTFSELTPEYLVDAEDFFEPGVPYRITIIKTDRAIRMRAVGPEKALYFLLDNERWSAITEGRIGLRQMHTRESLYKDFKVSVPEE